MTYTTQPTTLPDNGSTFSVEVKNTVGSVISNASTLTDRWNRILWFSISQFRREQHKQH